MTTKEALERLKQPFNATPDTDSYFDAKEVAIKSLEKDLSIIKELEDIKSEIEDLDLGFVDEDFQTGIAYGIMKFNQILDKHIKENN